MTTFLDEAKLMKCVPSIFATHGGEKVSSRYGFIPTIEVVRGLRTAGFHPTLATQNSSRIAGRETYVKHLLRFRHESMLAFKDGVVPEIVLVNSHDGTTSYQLRAGIYRLVCANGMIAGNEMHCFKVKHQGNVIEKVVDAANQIIEIVPLSVNKVEEWKGIELSVSAQRAYAESAMALKWEPELIPVKPNQILTPRRTADTGNDLWSTFNVVQENMIRGGVRYQTEAGSRMRTREVGSVSEDVRLNTALWTLTEKMAELLK